MSIKVCLTIGKDEPKAKKKARKPRAAKNGLKKPYSCCECKYSCVRPAELKRHKDTVHLKLKPHKCNQCDAAYGGKGDLNKHIKSAHEKAFDCQTCNKSCSTAYYLREHIKAVHEGRKVKCDYCEETFAFKSNKNDHIRRRHKNES